MKYLITGGTGTFGYAMAKHLLGHQDTDVVRIMSRDEVKQAMMRAQFKDDIRLRFLLGDVRDLARTSEAMRGIDVVFHAAALKRIEACAYDPEEAIRTNVLGSMNVLAAARAAGVSRVVGLSSDKACAPSTHYGATKLCMEAVFTSSTAMHGRYPLACVLRYGNVMGSRGSVLAKWRELGEPIYITDPQATRFWYTIEKAVELAMWAAVWTEGGELVVPRLPSFRLGDLAEAMCLHQKVQKMALRPGEKKHEAMISGDEADQFCVLDVDRYVRLQPGDWRGVGRLWLGHGCAVASNNEADLMTVDAIKAALYSSRPRGD